MRGAGYGVGGLVGGLGTSTRRASFPSFGIRAKEACSRRAACSSHNDYGGSEAPGEVRAFGRAASPFPCLLGGSTLTEPSRGGRRGSPSGTGVVRASGFRPGRTGRLRGDRTDESRHGRADQAVRAGAGDRVAVVRRADRVRRRGPPAGRPPELRGRRHVRVRGLRRRGLQGVRHEGQVVASHGLLPAPGLPPRSRAPGPLRGVRGSAGAAVLGAAAQCQRPSKIAHSWPSKIAHSWGPERRERSDRSRVPKSAWPGGLQPRRVVTGRTQARGLGRSCRRRRGPEFLQRAGPA